MLLADWVLGYHHDAARQSAAVYVHKRMIAGVMLLLS